MPKSTKAKLAVDGTAKLAAKSDPGDKHDKANLSIEEATVASPRPSRKRAGDFFDFEEETTAAEAATATKSADQGKAEKSTKRAKTATKASSEKPSKQKKSDGPTTKKNKAGSADASASAKEVTDAKADPAKDDDEPLIESAAGPSKDSKPKKTKASQDSASAKKDTLDTASTDKPVKKPASKKKSESKATSGPSETKSEKTNSKGKANQKGEAKASKTSKSKPTAKTAGDSTEVQATSDASNAIAVQVQTEEPHDTIKKKASGKAKAESSSESKPAKSKKKEQTLATETSADGPSKKDKGAGAAKAKKTPKPKDNEPDIPDQAIQPEDLVKMNSATLEPSQPEGSKSKKRKAAPTSKAAKSDSLSEEASESATKKQKTSRKSLGESVGALLASSFDAASGAVRSSLGGLGFGGGADGKTETASQKKGRKGKAADASSTQPAASDSSDDSESELDDQTAALLAGFESDGDELATDPQPGFVEGGKIPSIPKGKKLAKRLKDVAATDSASTQSGVVYVGRIPHGFYEHEMRDYFSQFGDISHLRLSRSRKTGRSKHYAFIEFANADVATIVAETMDNYLMFGHILKCKTVAPGDVHENLWKGADRRFKRVPRNKMAGRQLALPAGRSQWKKREDKEKARRASKAQAMQETMGYSFEGPELKSVDDLPVAQEDDPVVDNDDDDGGPTTDVIEEVTSETTHLVTAPAPAPAPAPAAASVGAEEGEEGGGVLVVSKEVKTRKTKKGRGKKAE